MVKAIIFDMDGVISDTQKFHAGIESSVLQEYGIILSPQQITRRYAGTKDEFMFETEFMNHQIKNDFHEAVKKKWELMNKISPNDIKPIPGIEKVIKDFSHSFVLAVASASPIHFIKRVLNSLHIEKYFSSIASGYEVKYSKPEPDIFLLAAKRLHTQPSHCVVIEDATNGTIAAKKAGMKSIGITTTHTKEDLKDATLVINSFSELSAIRILSL